ncbi:MAG: LacI family DNA-binding transcriptional regulator [Proteiniphilum sp.]|nr:LacI family DNA-binding transcriptional regulator [Proteiniphilum sp.]
MKRSINLIAQMANVSKSTVSRVFNHPDIVAKEKRDAVMEASRIIGYTPNKMASALRRKGSGNIVLLRISRENNAYWTNEKRNYWFFTEVILQLNTYFSKERYTLEIHSVENLYELQSDTFKQSCDGVIVYDSVTLDEAEYIKNLGVPYVLCHRTINKRDYNHCSTDNFAGGRLLAERFIECGYTKPAFFTDYHDPYSHEVREAGFAETFYPVTVRRYDIVKDETLLEEKTTDLIEDIKSGKIDCVGFVNDFTAVRCVIMMMRLGLSIPQDIAISGYDNSPMLLTLPFTTTTVDINMGAIYTEAAKALVALIEGSIDTIDRIVPPSLIDGETIPYKNNR